MKNQKVIKRRYDTEWLKPIDNYAKTKRFHYDRQFHAYMYDFMCVYYETMVEETIFQIQKHMLQTTRKFQLQYQSQKIGLDLVTYIQNILS